MPQQFNGNYFFVFQPCAKNKVFSPISSEEDEIKFMPSLNTFGYIEFDNMCSLSSLKDKIYSAEFSWLSRYSYHFIGK